MRDIAGTASLSNSSRFPLKSRVSLVSPVIFPPGRANYPLPSCDRILGCHDDNGIVLVACLAAWIPGRIQRQVHRP